MTLEQMAQRIGELVAHAIVGTRATETAEGRRATRQGLVELFRQLHTYDRQVGQRTDLSDLGIVAMHFEDQSELLAAFAAIARGPWKLALFVGYTALWRHWHEGRRGRDLVAALQAEAETVAATDRPYDRAGAVPRELRRLAAHVELGEIETTVLDRMTLDEYLDLSMRELA